MAITSDLVKHLRQLTGASMMLCKKALEDAGGDTGRALAFLKKSSEALAAKKSGRAIGAGVVEAYVHGGGKVGVLLELRCETDFVARNAEFKALAHDLALHVAGMNPAHVSSDQASAEAKEEARRLFMAEAENLGKSREMTERIVRGKLDAHFRDTSLLSQPYVKDQSVTVEELIKRSIAHFGERIEVARFVRYEI